MTAQEPNGDEPGIAQRVTIGLGLYTGQRLGGDGPGLGVEIREIARASEDAGFDAFWVSEHHGWPDGYLPSPLIALAVAASATTTISLGSGVVIAPLHDPIRLAEDAAVVDQLSGGRLVLGLGVGYLDAEYRMFGVAPSSRGQRLTETVEILRTAWRGQTFSYDGSVISLDAVRVTPSPVGDDDIPIWLGGYADAALKRAADLADGHLVGRGTPEIVGRAAAALVDCERRPFTFAANLAVVLDAPGGSADVARQSFARQQLSYERQQVGVDTYSGLVPAASGGETLTLGAISSYLQADGDPAHLAAVIHRTVALAPRWADVHIVLRAIYAEPDLDVQVERIHALGRLVLPLVDRAPGPLRRRAP